MFLIRKEIVNAFSEGIFPYIDGFQVEEESDKESMLEDEEIDTKNMPDLESEKSAKQKRNQQGKSLKNFNTKPNAE